MLKIYFLDRILFIKGTSELLPDINDEYITYKPSNCLNSFILDFEAKTNYKYAIIESHDVEFTLTEIAGRFKYIEAAGGVVNDIDNRILIIKRFGKYDLPKGKIEKGESCERAALREIEEECGIKQLEIEETLRATFHAYRLNGELIIKKTFWFNLKYSGNETPVPQTEEDITEVFWIDRSELSGILSNTYSSIIDVLDEVM